MQELLTKEQIIKRFKNKYISVNSRPFTRKDRWGKWVTLYEVISVKNKICENHNLPEEELESYE